jgi:uncharacterized protein YndB with AHSA1/START domain
MSFDLNIQVSLPASAKQVMYLLTDPKKIRAWSGADAVMELKEGGSFSMFDGWATGIVQHCSANELSYTWALDEWEKGTEPSLVNIVLKPDGENTLVILNHTNLPNQKETDEHKKGWQDYVFVPLEDYIMAFD